MKVNKKSRKNKLISLLLSVSLVMAAFVFPKGNLPIFEEKASAASVDDLTITFFHGVAFVSDCNENAEGTIVIPSETEIDGVIHRVTRIGASAFSDCIGLKSITIPETVTYIENFAFENCTGLESITISDGVKSIGNFVFENCTRLESIVIPGSVESIGEYAFYGCSGLKDITIPDSVSNIGSGAFDGCSALTDLPIPESISTIESSMFADCTGLKEVIIPGNIKSIGPRAFINCTELERVTIPDGVENIDDDAFYGCDSLVYFNVSEDNMYYSGDNKGVLYNKDKTVLICFPDGKQDSSFAIPEGVKIIGNSAFEGNQKLTTVTIPDSVTNIEDSAFSGCFGLTSIIIPDSVNYIGDEAFCYCIGLENVIIPESVNHIGDVAFADCLGLENIVIPDSVTNIGENAFAQCINLKSAEIGNGITELDGTFNLCYNLTDVKMPESLISSKNAFTGCASLKELEIPYGTKYFEESVNYGIFPQKLIVPETVDELYVQSPWLTDIVLYGDGVTNSSMPVGYTHYESNVSYDEFCDLIKNYEYYGVLCGVYGSDDYEEKAEEIWEQIISDVSFYDDPVPVKGLKIHGYENSLVQKYAEDNGFKFAPLQDSVFDSGITVSFDRTLADEVSLIAEKYDARVPKACTYTVAGMDQKGLYEICVKDINGKIVQPEKDKTFTVSIPVNYSDGTKLNILHVESDGKTSSIMSTTVTNSKIVFDIDRQ